MMSDSTRDTHTREPLSPLHASHACNLHEQSNQATHETLPTTVHIALVDASAPKRDQLAKSTKVQHKPPQQTKRQPSNRANNTPNLRFLPFHLTRPPPSVLLQQSSEHSQKKQCRIQPTAPSQSQNQDYPTPPPPQNLPQKQQQQHL
jgi:hypothetical protein